MSESARIVITGAAGFLGTRLIRMLRDRNQIIAIDREPPGQIALADSAAVDGLSAARPRPRDRLDILRRTPFMIENARTSPMEWYGRNLEALERHDLRPRFRVYRLVQKYEIEIDRRFAELLASQENPRLMKEASRLVP